MRSFKSSRNGRKRQADHNGNGYDQLEGEWALYYKVTSYFTRHIRFDDREDWLHDTMLEMAKVKAKYKVKGKPLTEAGLMRVASYQVTEYWERLRRLTTWLDCGNCSKEQRRKCREQDLYSECPKYHQLVSLNTTVNPDGDGEPSELIQFLADDKAVDIVARLDARHTLQGLPRRLVQIGYKRYAGITLNDTERRYFNRQRQEELKRHQKALF
ncbi:unnamed protein product [marine sediment metagenome]|uniref:Uncharacterized protein n=1 Tax=marine sediment metagenome TaxID=412755 RepID=X1JNF9_9ZZZZ